MSLRLAEMSWIMHLRWSLIQNSLRHAIDRLAATHSSQIDLVLALLCSTLDLTLVSNDREMLDLDFPRLVTGLN